MQRTAIILLAAALVATATFAVITFLEKEDLAAQLGAAPAVAEVTPPEVTTPAPPEPEPVTPEPQPEPAPVTPPTVASTEPAEEPEAAAEEGAESSANPLAAMMENPVMRDMIKQQMTAQFKAFYGSFFESYGVDDELAQPLYDLLMDRQMVAMDKVGVLFDKNASDEDKKAARDEIATAWEGYNDEFRELLGDDAYEEFQRFEQSASERMELTSLKGAMESAGHDFSVEKEEKLMAIMFEERQNFDFTNNFADQSKAFEQEFSKENFERFAEEYETLQTRISERTAEVLNTEEQAVFNKNQEDYLNMLKAGLQMQSQMFGGGQ